MSVGMSPDKNIVVSVEIVRYALIARMTTVQTCRQKTALFLAADVAVSAHTSDAFNSFALTTVARSLHLAAVGPPALDSNRDTAVEIVFAATSLQWGTKGCQESKWMLRYRIDRANRTRNSQMRMTGGE